VSRATEEELKHKKQIQVSFFAGYLLSLINNQADKFGIPRQEFREAVVEVIDTQEEV